MNKYIAIYEVINECQRDLHAIDGARAIQMAEHVGHTLGLRLKSVSETIDMNKFLVKS